eukprot:6175897-Pleurochrysis_carterae.AAC.3
MRARACSRRHARRERLASASFESAGRACVRDVQSAEKDAMPGEAGGCGPCGEARRLVVGRAVRRVRVPLDQVDDGAVGDRVVAQTLLVLQHAPSADEPLARRRRAEPLLDLKLEHTHECRDPRAHCMWLVRLQREHAHRDVVGLRGGGRAV